MAKSLEFVRNIKPSQKRARPFSPAWFYLRATALPGVWWLLFLLVGREAEMEYHRQFTQCCPRSGVKPPPLHSLTFGVSDDQFMFINVYGLNYASHCPAMLIPSLSLLSPASRAQFCLRLSSLGGSHLTPCLQISILFILW